MIEALYSILWIYILLLALKQMAFFRDVPGLSFKILVAFFLIKVAAGAFFILIYTYYYDSHTADIFRYFNESQVLSGALRQNFPDFLRMLTGIGADAPHLQEYYEKMHYWWDPELYPIYNNNRLMIRYNALLNLISAGNIHVNSIIANFFSLAGLIAIYKFALRHLRENKTLWLKFGIFLFPSMIFWGSGLIKEILLIPVMGFFLYFSDKIFSGEKLKIWQYLFFISVIFLFLLLKVYVFLLLLPCLLAFYLSGRFKQTAPGVLFPMVIAATILVIIAIGWLLPQYDLFAILARRQNSFMRFSINVGAGSLIHKVFLEPKLISIATYVPRALFNVLFRPHFFDSFNPVILSAAIENLFIVFILVLLILYGVREKKLNRLEWLGIWFTILLFTFIGITTQVYGTLVRLKIPALPILWTSFISLVPLKNDYFDDQKMKKRYLSKVSFFKKIRIP